MAQFTPVTKLEPSISQTISIQENPSSCNQFSHSRDKVLRGVDWQKEEVASSSETLTNKNGEYSYYLNMDEDKSDVPQYPQQEVGLSEEVLYVNRESQESPMPVFHHLHQEYSPNINSCTFHPYPLETSTFPQKVEKDTYEQALVQQERVRNMLKKFNKKKEELIKSNIKQKMSPAGSSGGSKSKIFTVENSRTPQTSRKEPPIIFTVEEEEYKAQYSLREYKKGCRTCKAVNLNIQPKIIYKKMKLDEGEEAKEGQGEVGGGEKGKRTLSELKNQREQQQRSIRKLPKRVQELDELNLENLLRLIEELENENKDLKKRLLDVLQRLAKLDEKESLLNQYEQEMAMAKKRLQRSNQMLKDAQNTYKIILGLVQELIKVLKLPEKQQKPKLQEIVNSLGQLVGGGQVEKLDKQIYENNLSSLMQDCLQQKIAKNHQQEISSMEKEFYQEKERLKREMNEDLTGEVEYYQTELDKVMNQNDRLESQSLSQNNQIKKLQDQLAELDRENKHMMGVLEEADEGLRLKDEYGLTILKLQDQQKQFEEQYQKVVDEMKGKEADMEAEKRELEALKKVMAEERSRNKGEVIEELEKMVDQKEIIIGELESDLNDKEQELEEKDRLQQQNDHKLRLLQQNLHAMEDQNNNLKGIKTKYENDILELKRDQERLKEVEIELNDNIDEKCRVEENLSDLGDRFKKLQNLLKNDAEFQRLEDQVGKLKSAIFLKSGNNLNDEDMTLLRDVFGDAWQQPSSQLNDRLNELQDQNNQLFFELRQGYDDQVSSLGSQQKQVKQLGDFSKALFGIDDKHIEYNKNATVAKRNYAPLYKNVEPILADIQQKIEEIRSKQGALDRLSIAKGIDKYDSDAYAKTLNNARANNRTEDNQSFKNQAPPLSSTQKKEKKVINNFNITHNLKPYQKSVIGRSSQADPENDSDPRRNPSFPQSQKPSRHLGSSNAIPERKASAHSGLKKDSYGSGKSLNFQDESQLEELAYLPEYGICKDDLLQFLNLQATYIEEQEN